MCLLALSFSSPFFPANVNLKMDLCDNLVRLTDRSEPVEGNFRVGTWLVAPRLNSISCNGTTIRLEPKVMQVLVCLAEARDVVSKETLMRTVWADTFVTDDVLTRSISELRKAFADDSKNPQYIQTIPKSGYRLVAPVEPVSTNGASSHDVKPADEPIAPTGVRYPRIAAAVLVLIALSIGSYLLIRRLSSGSAGPERAMLAILPFQSLSTDSSEEYFSDGLTAEMISQLGRLPSDRLGVIAWTSMRRYKNSRQSEDEIGRELGANYILEGTVRRNGDRVRITAELVKVGNHGRHIWANTYDGTLGDVLALQNRVAREIASGIEPSITPQEQKVLAVNTAVQPEAYDAYLKGRFAMEQSIDGYRKNIERFEEAIRLNPNYPKAYVSLAIAYRTLASFGYAPGSEAYQKGRAAALKAVELDPNSAEGHTELAWTDWRGRWDFAAADREFQLAASLNPGNAMVHETYALYLKSAGRFDDALVHARRDLELNPRAAFALTNTASLLGIMHRYDEALALFRKAIDESPNLPYPHQRMGSVYVWMGKLPEAITEFQKAVDLSHGEPERVAHLAYAYAVSGRSQEAQNLLRQLLRLSQQTFVSPVFIAMIYAGLHDTDNALDWLTTACDRHDEWMVYLNVYPEFSELHSQPRFRELVRRVGIPEPQRSANLF